MASIRKPYDTRKTIKRGNTEYPDTKLLTVGSAFLDQASGRINGQFRAVPPIWDGHFVILDPLPKREENGGVDPSAAEHP